MIPKTPKEIAAEVIEACDIEEDGCDVLIFGVPITLRIDVDFDEEEQIGTRDPMATVAELRRAVQKFLEEQK